MSMIYCFIALLAGALLGLSFAPMIFSPLAFFPPAVLLYIWSKGSLKQNAFFGFLFGFGFFAIGASWIFISIHQYGNASSFLAGLITFLFTATLALFFVLFALVFTYFFAKNDWKKLLLAYPLLWVIFEGLRGFLLTGFPWLFLGYTQIDSVLANLAPLVGVYGISLVIVFTSSVVTSFFILTNKKLLLIPTLLLILIFGFAFKIHGHHWTKISPEPIPIAIIQGNIAQELKWQKQNIIPIFDRYQKLSLSLKNKKIIFWPEAAITTFPFELRNNSAKMSLVAEKNRFTIIAGAPLNDPFDRKFYNALITFGEYKGEYLKRHLVPFGEYTPLKFLFGNAMGLLAIPMSNFSPGPNSPSPLTIGELKIAPFICYEIAYPGLVLESFPSANLIFTASDDSWFGRSMALFQHFTIARMRSKELGRYQVVASNTGISAIIDDQGEVVKMAPLFSEAILEGEVYSASGATLWNRIMARIP
jgi:apolipoprotein N-acyltransferase